MSAYTGRAWEVRRAIAALERSPAHSRETFLITRLGEIAAYLDKVDGVTSTRRAIAQVNAIAGVLKARFQNLTVIETNTLAGEILSAIEISSGPLP